MAKRPVPRYDFKAFGEAIKTARKGRKESRKKVRDEMYISPRYLANIENKGQHPSLQIFFELTLRYNISVDQFHFFSAYIVPFHDNFCGWVLSGGSMLCIAVFAHKSAPLQ